MLNQIDNFYYLTIAWIVTIELTEYQFIKINI